MAQAGGYREELEHEDKQTDPNSHANRLIKQELGRLNKGEDEVPAKKTIHSTTLVEVHSERPQKISCRIRVPLKEYPRYNFVGKLLGPKGSTLKALQEQTGCKMAIMGRGSMRDKDKEEELRKEGGKYAHLEEDLHVLVECYAEMVEGYHRVAAAAQELKKFVIPQMQEEMYDGGEPMNGSGGRGGFRGGPPPSERGGRGGSFRGRGAGPPPPSSRGGRGAGPPPPSRGRGGPISRGGPPRGGSRGGAPPSRGGGRGAAPPSSSSYDGYGSQGGYGSGSYDSGYDGYGGQGYGSGDTDYSNRQSQHDLPSSEWGDSQYYDYGQGSTQNSSYDSYSGDYYDESWNSGGGKPAAPSGRGSRGQARSHPYQRPSSGGY